METPHHPRQGDEPVSTTGLIRLHGRAEGSPLPTVLTEGAEHIVRDANQAFCRFVGRDVGVVAGNRITWVVNDRGPLQDLLDRVYREGATDYATDVVFTNESATAHGTVIVSPIVLHEPMRHQGLVVQIVDTTDLVRARTQQAEAARDLQLANEKLIIAGLREQELAERAKRSEAEIKRLLSRESLLAKASSLLEASLDYSTTLQEVARLAVPSLADWCLVDVILGGSREQVAVAHVNPDKEAALRELGTRFSKDTDLSFGAQYVLLTGRSYAYPAVPDREGGVPGPTTTPPGIHRRLEATSHMCVPLKVRDKVFGVLWLVSESERRFQTDELELAEELAHRASWAIDNARLYQEAQVAIRVRDDVLSVVSHDLNNPLSGIALSAELLLHENSNETVRKPAAVIRRAAEHMRGLIKELLELASIQAGRLVLHRSPQDIMQVLDEALVMIEPVAKNKSVALDRKLFGEPFPVLCDKERIIRVLANLVGNAIKFTPQGGRIVVTIQYLGGELRIGVGDTGPGIQKDEMPRLFDAYWTGKKAGRKGTGLGLYIARGIVEAHGGRIWAESEPGAGSSFFFTIPSAAADAP